MTQPISCSVADACAATGIGRTEMYRLLNEGRVESRYHGRKRLVIWASLRDYIASLPMDAPR